MTYRHLVLSALLLTVATATTRSSAATAETSRRDADAVDFHWGIKIPLRDGVHLSATLYTTTGQNLPTACVFTLTPYIGQRYHDRGVYFAAHGFPFLTIDARGRGDSEGEFHPFVQEAQDGFDVVEWLAKQPYCNGKVAMWGGSYAGYDQWATAREIPPHLATIVPAAAPYIGVDFPMRENIFFPVDVLWLTLTSGHASQDKVADDAAFWSAIYRKWFESGRRFRDLDAILGNPSPTFQEWLTHPEPDAYWDKYNPTADQYARLRIPILTITGSDDECEPGAIEYYRRYMRNASPAARERHYLIIGPWDHAGTRTPKPEFGGLKVGPASLLDLPKLHLEWYAWTLQNGPKPEFLKKSVAYYVTGAEKWRYADTLDEVTDHPQAYFLDSTANANDVFAAGSLGAVPGKGQPDGYVYDPREVHGPEVDAEAHTDGGSLVDQSVTLALRGKELVYHSAPFERDTELSGFFRLSAWISIDCPDTDIFVSIYDIGSDGTSIRLSTDAVRARYREGIRTPKLIQTRAPLRYDFGGFNFVSREIKQGHRLRLVVAPIGRLVEATFVEKNYNAGGVVAEETSKDARPVKVRMFHDRAHPSVLYIPIGRAREP